MQSRILAKCVRIVSSNFLRSDIAQYPANPHLVQFKLYLNLAMKAIGIELACLGLSETCRLHVMIIAMFIKLKLYNANII